MIARQCHRTKCLPVYICNVIWPRFDAKKSSTVDMNAKRVLISDTCYILFMLKHLGFRMVYSISG